MERRKFTKLLLGTLAVAPIIASTKDNINNRTVQVKHNNRWMSCKMKDLDIGDTFRMFDPDGTAVSHKGISEWKVNGKPRQLYNSNNDYVWGVNCD